MDSCSDPRLFIAQMLNNDQDVTNLILKYANNENPENEAFQKLLIAKFWSDLFLSNYPIYYPVVLPASLRDGHDIESSIQTLQARVKLASKSFIHHSKSSNPLGFAPFQETLSRGARQRAIKVFWGNNSVAEIEQAEKIQYFMHSASLITLEQLAQIPRMPNLKDLYLVDWFTTFDPSFFQKIQPAETPFPSLQVLYIRLNVQNVTKTYFPCMFSNISVLYLACPTRLDARFALKDLPRLEEAYIDIELPYRQPKSVTLAHDNLKFFSVVMAPHQILAIRMHKLAHLRIVGTGVYPHFLVNKKLCIFEHKNLKTLELFSDELYDTSPIKDALAQEMFRSIPSVEVIKASISKDLINSTMRHGNLSKMREYHTPELTRTGWDLVKYNIDVGKSGLRTIGGKSS